jgi:hypothetical protein
VVNLVAYLAPPREAAITGAFDINPPRHAAKPPAANSGDAEIYRQAAAIMAADLRRVSLWAAARA